MSETKTTKPRVKKFKPDDDIACRSVRCGKLTHESHKTFMRYEWSGYGDVCDVKYQDLIALRASKSTLLYAPWIIIENKELCAQWEDVAKLYDSFEGFEDAEAIFELSNDEFETLLRRAPQGMVNVITSTAIKMLRDNTLDSITKIRIIDDVFDTDLSMFMS